MQMLYNSDSFAVVHILANAQEVASAASGESTGPVLPRHGFEIVDKRSGKEVYLDGSWAELFQRQIEAWQREHPTQEEVEEALERYATLAQTPVVVH
ncbi:MULTISPECIES: BTH_I0359 family protein [Tepidimonas]|jgi:hypothetical protein|uniref:Uncharacterized protein DUF3567 n=2 Tax=Tepidimonas TaxID=114248 RepID=A0A4R3LHY4_9BURK|nr:MULTISPECIES: DUF3567 domain-containing protein [Tepidimonas]MCX7815519.1 DUF3567 domain-containing protein [Tepidimonas ignava]TCS98064.1 uncharacterized protein DUF3567 [Tepidimonas ignava]TSE22571.1 hypothetical protein Tigna_01007 [Tepidimonas ignava]TSE26263.1 hypothetical protein Taqua_00737 [Tepidimonas aquatica]